MHVTSLEVSSHACIQEFIDTLRQCLCVRKTQPREKHLRRQTSKRTVRCCSCYRSLAVLILSPRSCVAHLCQHLVGLLELVMDGLEFLASHNGFALHVLLMAHLIEEGLQFCKL